MCHKKLRRDPESTEPSLVPLRLFPFGRRAGFPGCWGPRGVRASQASSRPSLKPSSFPRLSLLSSPPLLPLLQLMSQLSQGLIQKGLSCSLGSPVSSCAEPGWPVSPAHPPLGRLGHRTVRVEGWGGTQLRVLETNRIQENKSLL